MSYGYGSRRRRRDNPIFFPNQATDNEEVYGIKWGYTGRNDAEIEEGEEEIEVNEIEEEGIFIDGVRIRTDRIHTTSNKPTLIRYTTYLEEPILNVLKILKKNNQICVSKLINTAIKDYLKVKYN